MKAFGFGFALGLIFQIAIFSAAARADFPPARIGQVSDGFKKAYQPSVGRGTKGDGDFRKRRILREYDMSGLFENLDRVAGYNLFLEFANFDVPEFSRGVDTASREIKFERNAGNRGDRGDETLGKRSGKGGKGLKDNDRFDRRKQKENDDGKNAG